MKKEELKKIADDIFERYSKVERVYVTGDGQPFLTESDAGNHARRNRSGKELEVSKFLRS